MIVKDQKQAVVKQEGKSVTESVEMTLDMDSSQFIMQILSKNLYSDPIGSIVRETVSNALDSHRRAGVDKPVVVSLERLSSGYEFSVEDFGIGLDGDDVRDIISKYGKSTKRDSEFELGLYGIGFKCPLSYTSSFHFRVRKNGVERKYMMYEGEERNTIDLLYEQPTNEADGTKIIVPVKYGDWYTFVSKMKEQLAYFTNVYFNTDHISNNFSVFRTEHFQKSELVSNNKMHLCLDDVYYPLDFEKIGVKDIYVPVGLRFGLNDGIYPTPNRESIRYSNEAIAIIRDKISKVADYLVTKFNETSTVNKNKCNIEGLAHLHNYYKDNSTECKIGDAMYDISTLVDYSSVQLIEPSIEGVELLNMRKLFKKYSILTEYNIGYVIRGNRMLNRRGEYIHHCLLFKSDSKLYFYSDIISDKMKRYLRHINRSYGTSFIRKSKSLKLFGKGGYDGDSYYEYLSLYDYPRDKWRQVITEYQTMVENIIDDIENVDDIVIPDEWLEAQKKKRVYIKASGDPVKKGKNRIIKMQGTIIGKIAVPTMRGVSNCRFISWSCDIQKIHQLPYLIVYTSHDRSNLMDDIYNVVTNQKIKLITFSDRELKIVKKIDSHNLMSYEEFMKGNNKPFKRLATSMLIYNLEIKYPNVFRSTHVLKNICKSLNDDIIAMDKYSSKHRFCDHSTISDTAKKDNLYDMTIYGTYIKVKSIIEKLPFLDVVLKYIPYYRDAENYNMMNVLIDMCKRYKFRMNYDNYKLPEKTTN